MNPFLPQCPPFHPPTPGLTCIRRTAGIRALRGWLIRLCLLLLALHGVGAQALDTGERIQWPRLQTLDGRTIEPARLDNRYVFLQIWASWCPYCKLQNQSLTELQRRWEAKGGVMLTFSSDRSQTALRAYMDERAYRFPVVHMTTDLRQWMGKIRSVPTVFVIGPDGSVLKKIEGQMLEEDLFELADLLPNPPGGGR